MRYSADTPLIPPPAFLQPARPSNSGSEEKDPDADDITLATGANCADFASRKLEGAGEDLDAREAFVRDRRLRAELARQAHAHTTLFRAYEDLADVGEAVTEDEWLAVGEALLQIGRPWLAADAYIRAGRYDLLPTAACDAREWLKADEIARLLQQHGRKLPPRYVKGVRDDIVVQDHKMYVDLRFRRSMRDSAVPLNEIDQEYEVREYATRIGEKAFTHFLLHLAEGALAQEDCDLRPLEHCLARAERHQFPLPAEKLTALVLQAISKHEKARATLPAAADLLVSAMARRSAMERLEFEFADDHRLASPTVEAAADATRSTVRAAIEETISAGETARLVLVAEQRLRARIAETARFDLAHFNALEELTRLQAPVNRDEWLSVARKLRQESHLIEAATAYVRASDLSVLPTLMDDAHGVATKLKIAATAFSNGIHPGADREADVLRAIGRDGDATQLDDWCRAAGSAVAAEPLRDAARSIEARAFTLRQHDELKALGRFYMARDRTEFTQFLIRLARAALEGPEFADALSACLETASERHVPLPMDDLQRLVRHSMPSDNSLDHDGELTPAAERLIEAMARHVPE